MPSTKRASRKSAMPGVATLGLDLAKHSVHLASMDAAGQVLTRRIHTKSKLLAVTAKMPPVRIGMEACCGAHHLGRQLLGQGHDVRLMAPKHGKPYGKRSKTDARDAEACAAACQRPTMRCVPVKSEQHLSMQSLHRYRSRLVGNRTQLVNQARAFLLERGITVPQGRPQFTARLPKILTDGDNGLSGEVRALLVEMYAELEWLDEATGAAHREIVAEAQRDEVCARLREVPGIGAQTATALVAALGDGRSFEKGRDVAAWLGLTPRENSTGGKQRLGRISRQGNRYVRSLPVHCARTGLDALAKRNDQLGAWLRRMLATKDRRKGIVALAAGLARIAWALLTSGKRFESRPAAPQAA